jgi:GTP-binding protein EngB required for normal cell division
MDGTWPTTLQDAGLQVPTQPAQRDRVVILGRTQAGKTVFVARLYEQLWNSRTAEVHMRSLAGPNHIALMNQSAAMREGRWPDSTTDQLYTDVEVTFAKRKFRMTLLDYPGEIFSKAFVRGELTANDTIGLVEHVDRAAGLIVLTDPKNAVESRDQSKRADDDFGMQQVIHRIRSYPDGQNVPVAIVLTKCDERNELIRSLGGLETFAKTYLSNLLRPAGRESKLFKAVAVWTRKSSRTGQLVPDLDREPVNLVQPLIWVLQKILLQQTAQNRESTKQRVEFEADRLSREALEILNAQDLSLQTRIMQGGAKIAAANAAGGESRPALAEARRILVGLQELAESRKDRNFFIGFGLGIAALLGGGVWLALHLIR